MISIDFNHAKKKSKRKKKLLCLFVIILFIHDDDFISSSILLAPNLQCEKCIYNFTIPSQLNYYDDNLKFSKVFHF